MTVLEMTEQEMTGTDLVGPVIRAGQLAEAVIEAIEVDNPTDDVLVLDRDDYIRIHTRHRCRLTKLSLQSALGQPYDLAALEIDMPSFKGRLQTRTDEYVWYYTHSESQA